MLDLFANYQKIVKSFCVSLYEQEGNILRFKAEITFRNDSKLFIKEYVFENKARKYAYHWADAAGDLSGPLLAILTDGIDGRSDA